MFNLLTFWVFILVIIIKNKHLFIIKNNTEIINKNNSLSQIASLKYQDIWK